MSGELGKQKEPSSIIGEVCEVFILLFLNQQRFRSFDPNPSARGVCESGDAIDTRAGCTCPAAKEGGETAWRDSPAQRPPAQCACTSDESTQTSINQREESVSKTFFSTPNAKGTDGEQTREGDSSLCALSLDIFSTTRRTVMMHSASSASARHFELVSIAHS